MIKTWDRLLEKAVYFFVGKSPSKYCLYGANMIR